MVKKYGNLKVLKNLQNFAYGVFTSVRPNLSENIMPVFKSHMSEFQAAFQIQITLHLCHIIKLQYNPLNLLKIVFQTSTKFK